MSEDKIKRIHDLILDHWYWGRIENEPWSDYDLVKAILEITMEVKV